jgi:hypothetical protein
MNARLPDGVSDPFSRFFVDGLDQIDHDPS